MPVQLGGIRDLNTVEAWLAKGMRASSSARGGADPSL